MRVLARRCSLTGRDPKRDRQRPGRHWRANAAFGALWAWACLSAAHAFADEVRAAVATNFRDVAAELGSAFETATGHTLLVASGSTGKLHAQIAGHAPFDVFLSADAGSPARLEQAGHAVPGTRFTYATGRLVLWSPSGGDPGPERLAAGVFRHLAIANPDLAPYGLAAMQTLEALGLAGQLDGKLVFGENIGQAFAFVQTGNAEIGLVALSQVIALGEGLTGQYWLVPASLHEPIRQDAVLLARSAENEAARAFLEFLQGSEARAIIRQGGYETP